MPAALPSNTTIPRSIGCAFFVSILEYTT